MKNSTLVILKFLLLEMYSLEFRKAVIQLYKYFNSMRKTALALNISIASISRWTKNIEPKNYVRQNTKTSEALKSFILLKISEKPYMTCKEICALIYQHFNINVSKQLVHLIIKQSNMSYKRIRKRGASKHKQERIKDFVKQINELPKDSILVSIDESGFDHHAYPVYGYGKKGTQVVLEYPVSNDRKHYSLILAVSNNGDKQFVIKTSYVDSKQFNEFINGLTFPKNSVLLMDNASIHRTKELKEVLNFKEYSVVYTPPYSPEFNPIEMVFGNIKHHYYKHRYDSNTILETIHTLTDTISPTTIINCFNHVKNYIKTY